MSIDLITRVNAITRKADRIQLQIDWVQKALNCRGDAFYRLFCKELFDPKTSNHSVQNFLLQTIHETLLHGENVFLFTFGVSGTGKTHAFFGSDVR